MEKIPESFENPVPEIVVEPKCLPVLEKYKIRIDYQNGRIFLDTDGKYPEINIVNQGENEKVTLIYKNEDTVFLEFREKNGDIIIYEINKGLFVPDSRVHLKEGNENPV